MFTLQKGASARPVGACVDVWTHTTEGLGGLLAASVKQLLTDPRKRQNYHFTVGIGSSKQKFRTKPTGLTFFHKNNNRKEPTANQWSFKMKYALQLLLETVLGKQFVCTHFNIREN